MCSTTPEENDAAFTSDDFMLCTDKLAHATDNPLAGKRKRFHQIGELEDPDANLRWRPRARQAVQRLHVYNDLLDHIAVVGALLSESPNLQVSCLIMNNALIYLLGTDHVNPRCQIEVSHVIDIVKPDKVIVELCKLRACRCPVHMNSIFQNPAEFTFR